MSILASRLAPPSKGKVCSTLVKYNPSCISGGSGQEATGCEFGRPALPKSLGEVCSTYEKFNIELVVEGPGHEAFRCEC